MTGYAQPISDEGWEVASGDIIAVIFAPSFPALDEAVEILQQGAEAKPDAFWVCRDRDKLALEALHRAGLDPVRAPALPRSVFKSGGSEVRDAELFTLCTKVVIFHDPNAATTKNLLKRRYVDFRETIPRWQHDGKDKISVVERGSKKRRARAKRTPIGA